ncbi:MAG: tyrosine-type recombinase/integrase, partial [Planctomycetota bacterium]
RKDLATDLRDWVASRLSSERASATECGEAPPLRLPPTAPLLNVPTALIKIMDRDLAFAGIEKRDDLGRTVDVHALRHSFCTHLAKGAVPMRTGQAAMRHSDPRLTACTYTDPALLDVRAALDVLDAPKARRSLPARGPSRGRREQPGTFGGPVTNRAPKRAPNSGGTQHPGAVSGRERARRARRRRPETKNVHRAENRPYPPARAHYGQKRRGRRESNLFF